MPAAHAVEEEENYVELAAGAGGWRRHLIGRNARVPDQIPGNHVKYICENTVCVVGFVLGAGTVLQSGRWQ